MKAGYVGLVGLPNAGKSTLVNALIGEKISIVSRKPQTTRKRVLGIYSDDTTQAIFLDAPGLVKAEAGLNHFMQKELESVINESDILIAVLNLDSYKIEPLLEIIEMCQKSGKPWMACLTKDDLSLIHRNEKLREVLQPLKVPIILTSAVRRPNELKELILTPVVQMLPETKMPYYDDEIYTTQSEREILAEMVREQCFEYLHEELPYGVAVKTLEFKEEDTIIRCLVEIIVAKDNYVGMVVGQGGQTIKRIGASSRILAEKFFNKKIFLQTQVKVRKDWTSDEKFMKEMGYVVG
jgi:GTP-binding protein Era